MSRIVVRTRDSAPAARVLVAANDEPPQLVGVLSAPVTGLALATPVMASNIFVESEEPAVIVDVAAFANDEMP